MNQGIKNKFFKAIIPFLTLALVSCSCEELPELEIQSVSIYATPEANQNSAIAVDLVIVHNLELLKTIGKMSAAKYFASVRQLLLDNPSLLDIWHWELVPGQMVSYFVPEQCTGAAYGAYVFANYLTPGEHRLKVAPDGIVNILLLRDDLRNLATSTASDRKLGTTMSTVPYARTMGGYNAPCSARGPCGPCDPSDECNEQSTMDPRLSYTNMGPCEGEAPTCQRRAPPPCPVERPFLLESPCAVEPPCTNPSQPAQIVTRPLDPPRMMSPQSYDQ